MASLIKKAVEALGHDSKSKKELESQAKKAEAEAEAKSQEIDKINAETATKIEEFEKGAKELKERCEALEKENSELKTKLEETEKSLEEASKKYKDLADYLIDNPVDLTTFTSAEKDEYLKKMAEQSAIYEEVLRNKAEIKEGAEAKAKARAKFIGTKLS